MRAADIVAQLQNLLPQYTDLLTDPISASIQWGTTVLTVTTLQDHGLQTADPVVISGVELATGILTFTRTIITGATDGVITTAGPHQITYDVSRQSGVLPKNAAGKGFVTTSGSAEADFNGDFVVTQVVNKTTIHVTMREPYSGGDTSGTGTVRNLENSQSSRISINTSYPVGQVTGRLVFKLTSGVTLPTGVAQPIGTILVHPGNPRIGAAATVERAREAYTKQDAGKAYAYVVLGDVIASKSREIDSDGIDNIAHDTSYRQQLIQPFVVLVFFPKGTDELGADARDLADDLFGPMTRSLVGTKFGTGLSLDEQNALVSEGHGIFEYQDGGPFYVHQYGFQQTVDLRFEDTVDPPVDVAFREIDYTLFPVEQVDDPASESMTESAMPLEDVP